MIENMNRTTGKPFEDGAHILYVNGEYRGEDAIGELMHDFNCSDPESMKNSRLREKSRYYKESKEGIAEMCKAIEDMLDITVREKMWEVAMKMLQRGELSHEDIADYTGFTLEEVEELAKRVPA